VASIANAFILASAAALLLLNYINSALAFQQFRDSSPALLWSIALIAAALAVALSLGGLALGWLLAWLIVVKPATRTTLMFGLSMKHTGLALILAAAVLEDQPLVILIIVLATLTQHLLAGLVQWYIARTEHAPPLAQP
jgi:BASS family bile acid:Na+ symporter